MPVPKVKLSGKRYVIVEEGEYNRMISEGGREDAQLPPLPDRLANGNWPAIEYSQVSLARKLILARRRAGLSQAEVARRAGIRPETLNRIDRAKMTPSVATVAKIEGALGGPVEGGKARSGRRG